MIMMMIVVEALLMVTITDDDDNDDDDEDEDGEENDDVNGNDSGHDYDSDGSGGGGGRTFTHCPTMVISGRTLAPTESNPPLDEGDCHGNDNGDDEERRRGRLYLLTPSLLCVHVHQMMENKMLELKSCSFFFTSMWTYLHQNTQFITGPENYRFASLWENFLALKIYGLGQ